MVTWKLKASTFVPAFNVGGQRSSALRPSSGSSLSEIPRNGARWFGRPTPRRTEPIANSLWLRVWTSQWEVIKTSQMDKDEQLGQPVVPNGIPLSKIHHAAFDASSDAELNKVASEGIALIRSGVHLEPRRLWGSDRRIGSLTLHQDTEGPHVLSTDFAVHAEPEELRELSRQGRAACGRQEVRPRRAHDQPPRA